MKVGICPGAANIKGTPTLEIKKCPECGAEIEIFSSDTQRACEKCGFVVYANRQSCMRWCRNARECVGERLYEQLMAEQKKEEK